MVALSVSYFVSQHHSSSLLIAMAAHHLFLITLTTAPTHLNAIHASCCTFAAFTFSSFARARYDEFFKVNG